MTFITDVEFGKRWRVGGVAWTADLYLGWRGNTLICNDVLCTNVLCIPHQYMSWPWIIEFKSLSKYKWLFLILAGVAAIVSVTQRVSNRLWGGGGEGLTEQQGRTFLKTHLTTPLMSITKEKWQTITNNHTNITILISYNTWSTQYFQKADVRPKNMAGAQKPRFISLLWWIVNPINHGRRRIFIVRG